MTHPNLYTLTEGTETWGLHRYKDGETVLVNQHKSGDWWQLRRATPHEITVFEKHGERVVSEPKIKAQEIAEKYSDALEELAK